MYCLEEVDNGKDLHLLEVNPDGKYEIKDSEICGNPVKVVEMDGFRVVDTAKKDGELYHVYKRKEKEAVALKFVPYYTWANRGENEMEVWIRIKIIAAQTSLFLGKPNVTFFLTLLYLHVTEFFGAPREQL